MTIIKFKQLNPDAQLPIYAHPGDAGADLVAAEDCILQPLERKAISTGLSVEIPIGFEIQVRPRSGLALKHGITVLNSPGTIDAGYRGEIKVILINLGTAAFEITKGQRIAQMVVAPVVSAEFQAVVELADSQRGEGGFGSTGNRAFSS
jgi:dUTP pyrophosphatase